MIGKNKKLGKVAEEAIMGIFEEHPGILKSEK